MLCENRHPRRGPFLVPEAVSPVHADAAWLRLARHEQRLLNVPLRPIAPTLWIGADATWCDLVAAAPMLTRLHVNHARLQGDLVCHLDALPIERDSVQTIVVQHVAEVLVDPVPLIRELARVLEPGGQLFWFGLNPISAWAAWSLWRGRPGHAIHARGIRQLDLQLAEHGVDAIDSRYLGPLWPNASPVNEARRFAMIDGLRAGWLLSARKRRAVLTPLRAAARPRRLSVPPLSALPSSRNER